MSQIRFSMRNGFAKCSFMNQGVVTDIFRSQVWHLYFKNEESSEALINFDNSNLTYTEDILAKFGLSIQHPVSGLHGVKSHLKNIQTLKIQICNTCDWYQVYDFIELYADMKNSEHINDAINSLLEENLSAYRLVDSNIIPVIDESHINEIELAANQVENRSKHIQDALNEYSKKTSCNYNKVITDSISALEATVVDLVDGKNDTLGRALNHYVATNGANEDEHLITAIKNLYKFSCNAGMRHGGTEYIETTDAEARLYLVVSSAISNYLASKMLPKEETIGVDLL